ncbi:MAG: DGQHR domain-containing protein [Chloroflexaceae bacterium]|nr:DGQHR domain-containing protein [Chloroflexaceae bacterium]
MESRKFFGCRIAQRGRGDSVEFVVFITSVKDVLNWAGVKRVGKHEKGTQRIVTPSRVRAIKRFIASDKKNTIPVGVIVAFEQGKAFFSSLQEQIDANFVGIDSRNGVVDKMDWGVLSFDYKTELPDYQKPALIVDGQHRVFGMASISEEDLPVLVVALIEATPEEQAFQFVVINNKAAKVPTDNVKAIIASFDEPNLQQRLLNAGVSYGNVSSILKDINEDINSPFYQLLIWPLSKDNKGEVQLTTIETCLRYIRDAFRVEEEETRKEVFLAVWRAVTRKYDNLWKKNEKFMSKVNLIALNDCIVDRLAYAWEGDLVDIYKPETIENQTIIALNAIPSEFWFRDWNYAIQDNNVVRKIIKDDLNVIIKNAKRKLNWDADLKSINTENEDNNF